MASKVTLITSQAFALESFVCLATLLASSPLFILSPPFVFYLILFPFFMRIALKKVHHCLFRIFLFKKNFVHLADDRKLDAGLERKLMHAFRGVHAFGYHFHIF